MYMKRSAEKQAFIKTAHSLASHQNSVSCISPDPESTLFLAVNEKNLSQVHLDYRNIIVCFSVSKQLI